MANEELKSQEPVEEESILNRPKPKLVLANDRKPKVKVPDQVEPELKIEEPPKPDKVEIAKEKMNEAVEFAKKKFENSFSGGVSLKMAGKCLFSNGKLIIASLSVVLAMIVITIFSYHQISSWMNILTAPFFSKEPVTAGFFDYFYYLAWLITKMFFRGIVAIIAFYISFLFAYALTSPLYSFISIITEDIVFGKPQDDADFTFDGIAEDVLQALKIAGVALIFTVFAFFMNFIPVLGQIIAICVYIVINSLMLVDFSASRRRWNLKTKTQWVRENIITTLRIGSLPTLISMFPIINNILLAFLFPLFVVHATMNFAFVEKKKKEESIKEEIHGQ